MDQPRERFATHLWFSKVDTGCPLKIQAKGWGLEKGDTSCEELVDIDVLRIGMWIERSSVTSC